MDRFIYIAIAFLLIGCGGMSDQPSYRYTSDGILPIPDSIYPVAIIQLSWKNRSSRMISDFGTLPDDILRISHGKTGLSFTFFGPYSIDPVQIGCNGTFKNDNQLLMIKALELASLSGVQLSKFKHIWFNNDADLQPACFVSGASGGNWGTSPPGFEIQSMTGYISNHVINGNLAAHEFFHGLNGPGLNPHVGLANCTSDPIRYDNPNCTFQTNSTPEGVPGGVWVMGGSTFGQDQDDDLFDIDPVFKANWSGDWLSSENIADVSSKIGIYEILIHPSDDSSYDPTHKTAVRIKLPPINGNDSIQRAIWFEYKKNAHIGLNHENRPGVYIYYEESRIHILNGIRTINTTSNLLKIGTLEKENYAGLHPMVSNFTVINGSSNIIAKSELDPINDTYKLTVDIFGTVQ